MNRLTERGPKGKGRRVAGRTKEGAMARSGHSGARGAWAVGVAAIATLAFVTPSVATLKYGPVQLAGSVSSQNLVRHHDFRENYQPGRKMIAIGG